MSEPSLSEKMEEWPANLYELFGVDQGVNERDLRKAYHRLIKRFKPEHAPDQFRKLNEAYESLRIQVRYDEQYRQQEDTDENDDDSEWMAHTTWRTVHNPAEPVSSIETKREELWQLALRGEMLSGVEQFESLCDENPDDEESLLRLYWLQRLASGEPPLDRMEDFLKKRGPACRLFAMYLLEVERRSSVSLRPCSRELLLATVIQHESTQLAQSAWLQLVRRQQFIRIGHDLDDLKPELAYDHPALWTLIVYEAAEILALNKTSKGHPLMQRLLGEIRECEPTHENEWIETRWNLVQSLMIESSTSFDGSDRLLSLIRASMLGEGWEHRCQLERIAEPWVASPDLGLQQLDRLRHYSSSAVYLLHRFAEQLLDDRQGSMGQQYFENLSPRLIEFGETQAPQSYGGLRETLVQFCRMEDLDLDLFINQILELEKRGRTFRILNDETIAALSDDWPLRCLISCVRLFNE